ncbi:MAG TPA: shikimate kinase, partial [Burkholderiaceae bacterium]|nr:shikimate kinase [Burkholderiaceae bacterium]
MVQSLVLVGMMGAGKTTIGRRLAADLRAQFYDMDAQIELLAGVTIGEIFAREGETGFRLRETRLLDECIDAAQQDPTVLSTGGGIVASAHNREAIRASGLPVVYLHATPSLLYGRLQHDRKRPLLQNEDPRGTIDR